MAEVPKPFDAAVVRYRHDPATGEFVNIGVALAARDGSFHEVMLLEDWGRIFSTFPSASSATLDAISRTLRHALPRALSEKKGLLDALHAIFPPDDSGVDIGVPVSGAAPDLARTLQGLFARQVRRHLPATVDARVGRTRAGVGNSWPCTHSMKAKEFVYARCVRWLIWRCPSCSRSMCIQTKKNKTEGRCPCGLTSLSESVE